MTDTEMIRHAFKGAALPCMFFLLVLLVATALWLKLLMAFCIGFCFGVAFAVWGQMKLYRDNPDFVIETTKIMAR